MLAPSFTQHVRVYVNNIAVRYRNYIVEIQKSPPKFLKEPRWIKYRLGQISKSISLVKTDLRKVAGAGVLV